MNRLSVDEDVIEEPPGGIDDESGGGEQTDCKSDVSGGEGDAIGGGETDSKGDDESGGDEADCKSDAGGEDVFSDDGYDEELGDLPPEIAGTIGNRRFQSEEDLQLALDKAGGGDLRVVLVDGRPRLVMASHQHNCFTAEYHATFLYSWAKNRWADGAIALQIKKLI
jgi:hypothetical protein